MWRILEKRLANVGCSNRATGLGEEYNTAHSNKNWGSTTLHGVDFIFKDSMGKEGVVVRKENEGKGKERKKKRPGWARQGIMTTRSRNRSDLLPHLVGHK